MSTEPRVLVVDDNAGLLATFSLILKRRGYDVDMAEDGISALEKFDKNSYDVILMDIVMPRMNGVEAFRKIKTIDPAAKVILMTAYYDDDGIKKALEEGVYSAINKPVDIARLLDMIKEATSVTSALIVDDDEDFCGTMAKVLESKGYLVSTINRGQDAIDIARIKEIQVAFIDVKMPDMDGLETYLRMKELNPVMVGVMMTAYRDEVAETIEKARVAKASTCIYKPFDPSQVIDLLNKVYSK